MTLGMIVSGIIMASAFIAMLYCAKVQRSQPRAKTLAIMLLAVILASGGFIVYRSENPGNDGYKNAIKLSRISTTILGQHLGQRFPDCDVLVIVPDKHQNDAFTKAQLEGLENGFSATNNTIVIGSLRPQQPSRKPDNEEPFDDPMISEMMTACQFDQVIEAHKHCQLVVFLVNLPYDVADMKIWQMPAGKRPKVALVNCDIYGMKRGIAAGAVSATITNLPGADFSKDASSQPDIAFKEHFLLVTDQNVMEIAKQYPTLFAE